MSNSYRKSGVFKLSGNISQSIRRKVYHAFDCDWAADADACTGAAVNVGGAPGAGAVFPSGPGEEGGGGGPPATPDMTDHKLPDI